MLCIKYQINRYYSWAIFSPSMSVYRLAIPFSSQLNIRRTRISSRLFFRLLHIWRRIGIVDLLREVVFVLLLFHLCSDVRGNWEGKGITEGSFEGIRLWTHPQSQLFDWMCTVSRSNPFTRRRHGNILQNIKLHSLRLLGYVWKIQ